MGSALIRIFERPFYRKLHQPGEIVWRKSRRLAGSINLLIFSG